jgi:hypothetical protein
VFADGISQDAGQDRPQPNRALSITFTPELVADLVRPQERLLNQVRGIELALQLGGKLESSQEHQVVLERFQ